MKKEFENYVQITHEDLETQRLMLMGMQLVYNRARILTQAQLSPKSMFSVPAEDHFRVPRNSPLKGWDVV